MHPILEQLLATLKMSSLLEKVYIAYRSVNMERRLCNTA